MLPIKPNLSLTALQNLLKPRLTAPKMLSTKGQYPDLI